MASLDDVLLALGRVQEGVEQLREDFRDEKQTAHESRAALHRRLDEQASDIASLKTDVKVAGLVEAQVRDEVRAIGEKVDANQAAIGPHVDDWKRMKAVGVGLVGLLAVGGLSVGAMLTWASETAITTIRHWLRIA